MDSHRFDNWTRNRALRLSRRDALRLVGASGVAAAIPGLSSNALAQTACSLTVQAETIGGPSAPASYSGVLELTLDAGGSFSQATFTPASGAARSATGRATGRAVDILLTLPGNQTLALSGVGAEPIAACSRDIAGILTGPQPGDVGVWQATAGTPSGAAPSSEGNESGSTAACPANQTLCGGSCVDTQIDPGNCGGCGTVCESGACAGGTCGSGSVCVPDGEPCRVPADCCSLLCPHDLNAPGVCGCSQVGGVCRGGGDCCQQGGDTRVSCLGGANSDRCIVVQGACTSDSDCLGQSCVNGMCGSACNSDGSPCGSAAECCSQTCSFGFCGCAQLGQSCNEAINFFCCDGTPTVCLDNACCILNTFPCSADADCCDYIQAQGSCTNGVCTRNT